MQNTAEQFAREGESERIPTHRDPSTPTEWLTPADAARYVKLAPRTLQQMRAEERGPRFFKAGRLVRYRLSDLDDWLGEGGR